MRVRALVFMSLLFGQIASPGLASRAEAGTVSPVTISELQVAGAASASDEFVELYNASPDPVDLAKWSLEYRSATSSSGSDCAKGWTKKATIASGHITGHGFYLVRATGFGAGDASFSPGLAGAAGTIRILDASSAPADALAWGKSLCGNGAPAATPSAGRSLERRPGSDLPTGGNAYDTGDNAADFMVRTSPEPQGSSAPPEIPVEDYVPSATPVSPAPESGGLGGSEDTSGASANLEINELLPDPASPATDAKDEFIELYNPTDAPINLAGYVMKTGTNLSTKHTLPDVTIGSASYLALMSGNTKIALANTGSSVALFDPAGHQIGTTITYAKSKAGQAWARFDTTWAWTTTPTPGAANNLSDPVIATAAAKASSASKSSKASSSSSKSIKSTKTTKAATTKKPKAAKISSSPVSAAATSTGGRWLLFALAGLTIGYIIYEFRYDLRNFYEQLRGHAGARISVGALARRRGGHRVNE